MIETLKSTLDRLSTATKTTIVLDGVVATPVGSPNTVQALATSLGAAIEKHNSLYILTPAGGSLISAPSPLEVEAYVTRALKGLGVPDGRSELVQREKEGKPRLGNIAIRLEALAASFTQNQLNTARTINGIPLGSLRGDQYKLISEASVFARYRGVTECLNRYLALWEAVQKNGFILDIDGNKANLLLQRPRSTQKMKSGTIRPVMLQPTSAMGEVGLPFKIGRRLAKHHVSVGGLKFADRHLPRHLASSLKAQWSPVINTLESPNAPMAQYRDRLEFMAAETPPFAGIKAAKAHKESIDPYFAVSKDNAAAIKADKDLAFYMLVDQLGRRAGIYKLGSVTPLVASLLSQTLLECADLPNRAGLRSIAKGEWDVSSNRLTYNGKTWAIQSPSGQQIVYWSRP